MATIRRVYWDACIFIKHISPKSDPKSKSVLDGIDEVVNDAENDRSVILTSSITRVEVLDCNIPPDGETRYLKFLRREIVQEFDVDPRIAAAAHDIRAFYRKQGRDLGVADSIHIATACLREADEMLTLDGTGKKPGLISLSGKIADKWHLTIREPHPTVGRLFPFTPDVPDESKTEPTTAPQLKEKTDDKET